MVPCRLQAVGDVGLSQSLFTSIEYHLWKYFNTIVSAIILYALDKRITGWLVLKVFFILVY